MSNYPKLLHPVEGYAHQSNTRDVSWDKEFYGLLWEMGCGKSKTLIDSFCGLAHHGYINGVLILAPKGAYLNWPLDQLPKHMVPEINYYVGVWSSTMNKQQEAKCRNVMEPIAEHLDILVMNIEALNSDRAMMFAINFLERHNAMTIIDESDCIKNPQAARTKKAMTLSKLSRYRRIATGTPITQSPLDLFTQFEFLSRGCLRFTSFTAFRSYYANMVLMELGTRRFPKIVGYRNLDQLQESIRAFSDRKLKIECVDLPPKIYSTRYLEMTDEQERIYSKFRDEALITLGSSEATSTSALTTIMRLQQIACGHLKMDDGTMMQIPNNRVSLLQEILEEVIGKKVIIWCHFKEDVRQVMGMLSVYGNDSGEYGVDYYGDTTDKNRPENLSHFMQDPKCMWLVGTPSTGGRGLTLTVSHTTIYYSNGYMLSERLQSEDRNHRIGQTEPVNIIDIVCNKTVDPRIVNILKAKKDLASLVLDSYQELLSP